MSQETLELMAKLAGRLADPDRLDESREAVGAAVQALNYALTPSGQLPPAIPGEFQVMSSRIEGLAEPDFRLPPDAVLPDLPDLPAAQSSHPPPPEIKYLPLSLGERAAALFGLTARPVRAAWSQVEERAGRSISGRDIAAVALSSILGGDQTITTKPRLREILTEEDELKEVYLEGLESLRDKFGNFNPSSRDKTPADEQRERLALENPYPFDHNLDDWLGE